MKKEINAFRERILIDAITVVEDNDYIGLLIAKAKAIIQENGTPHNRQTPSMLMMEMIEAIQELENYRLLNLSLKEMQGVFDYYDALYFERYFKSRIISAKRILLRLSKFGSAPYSSSSEAFRRFIP